jgi:HicB family
MPTGLHGELARAADREGVSLNQFISNALAGAVGWGREGSNVTSAASAAPKSRSRWLMFLLAANLILVAAAAISAIVFLVAAWVTG